MRVLVTGGTGFIGSHLVEALLKENYLVRCLVRSKQKLRWLRNLPVELCEGDCTRPASLRSAVEGMNWVVHTAGLTNANTHQAFMQQNCQGTENLIDACIRYNPDISRFIFLSSQAAAGPSNGKVPRRDEDLPAPITAYGQSKLNAETLLGNVKDQIPSTILRPSTVYGPRDLNFLPYLKLADKGVLLDFGSGERTISLCYVDDLVRGILQSMQQELPSGSVYFFADKHPYQWTEFEESLKKAMSLGRTRKLTIPIPMVIIFAWLGQIYGKLTGKPVMINRLRLAEFLHRHWACDSTRLRRDLDFKSKWNLLDGLKTTVTWYGREGWL